MSGCYGNDLEDKYFEDKLINQELEDAVNCEKFTMLNDELLNFIREYIDNNKVDTTFFEALDDVILPILDILESENICTPNTLQNMVDQLKVSDKNMNNIKFYTDELELCVGRIVDLTKEL